MKMLNMKRILRWKKNLNRKLKEMNEEKEKQLLTNSRRIISISAKSKYKSITEGV